MIREDGAETTMTMITAVADLQLSAATTQAEQGLWGVIFNLRNLLGHVT